MRKCFFVLIWVFSCFGLEANGFKVDFEETDEQVSWRKDAAYDYLHMTWLKMGYKCVLSNQKELINGRIIDENFSTIVIMELLLDLELDTKVKQNCLCFLSRQLDEKGLVCFFTDKSLYPADVDTTALAISVLTKAGLIDQIHSWNGINEIINNTTASGIIDVYFDQTGEKSGRVDPVVCANALYVISLYEKESEAEKSLDFIYQTLISETYSAGTRYYPSQDAFLFVLSRLVESFPKMYDKFVEPLKERVAKRIGSTENPLDLAMRIIACNNLGIKSSKEKAKLASLQLEDGSWPAYSYFTGSNSRYFGSREISTAFAIKALSR